MIFYTTDSIHMLIWANIMADRDGPLAFDLATVGETVVESVPSSINLGTSFDSSIDFLANRVALPVATRNCYACTVPARSRNSPYRSLPRKVMYGRSRTIQGRATPVCQKAYCLMLDVIRFHTISVWFYLSPHTMDLLAW